MPRTFYTWCATDTLFFSIILAEHTVAESTCSMTGAPIRVEITPEGIASVAPAETVVSQRHPRELVGSLRSEVCDHGQFFASRANAAEWLASHPDGGGAERCRGLRRMRGRVRSAGVVDA